MHLYRILLFSILFTMASSTYSAERATGPFDTAHSIKNTSNGSLPIVVGKGYLTVASNNGYWSRVNYEQGDQPSLSAFDDGGIPLPDGVYRYEYRSASHESNETGVAERISMFDQLVSARRPGTAKKVSGTFRVTNGMIVP